MTELLISTIAQGLQWSILALGVFLTFRVLDIADLSVEGSFPLGAAVAATAISSGCGFVAASLLALVAGALAGAVTGFLTTKLKIPALLAGILTMIGLYSINLHVMGKANISLLQDETIFTWLEQATGLSSVWVACLIGFIVTAIVVNYIYWFFGTELGTAIRATGFNPQMARAQGIQHDGGVGTCDLERPRSALWRCGGTKQWLCRYGHGRWDHRDWSGERDHRGSDYRQL